MPKKASPLTQSRVNKLEPRKTRYDIRDGSVNGLVLHVLPTGSKRWYCQPVRLGKRYLIGDAEFISLAQARNAAIDLIAEHESGNLRHKEKITLGRFIEKQYEPWIRDRNKSAAMSIRRLKVCFGNWYEQKLHTITTKQLERWRNKRIADGLKPSTVKRDLNNLFGALSTAVKLGYLEEAPAKRMTRIKIKDNRPPRYLTESERERLARCCA